MQGITFLEVLPYLLYTLIGPLAWAYMFGALRTERSRMMRPELLNAPLPDPPPRVTILLPANNEQRVIRGCVDAALKQDYPDFKIVVVDDRSTDDTGKIVDEMATRDGRLQVLHLSGELPAGWSGKNYAVAQGMKLVEGTRVLFLDADCTLAPGALRAAMAAAEARRVDLVSFLPGINAENFWEQTVGPAFALLGSILDRGLREPYSYGWFMLFSRESYDKIGGHAALRELLDDDKLLPLRLYQQGMRCRVYWGTEYTTMRLGRRLPDMIRGFARNLFTMSRGRPWRAMFLLCFILLSCVSAYPALILSLVAVAWRGWSVYGGLWLAGSIFHVSVMTAAFARMYRWGGVPARSALALPFTLVFCVAICVRAMWNCVKGVVTWHGIEYRYRGGKTWAVSQAQAENPIP